MEQEKLTMLKELLITTYEKVYKESDLTVSEILEDLKAQLERIIV